MSQDEHKLINKRVPPIA